MVKFVRTFDIIIALKLDVKLTERLDVQHIIYHIFCGFLQYSKFNDIILVHAFS